MISALVYINTAFVCLMLLLVYLSRSPWAKVLSNRLAGTFLVTGIVLHAIARESSGALDVALAFSILAFVDVQFLSVFLRKKGEL